MAAEENNTVTMEKKIHGGDKFSDAGTYACGFSSPMVTGDVSKMQNSAGRSYYDGKESFYEKLNKLNESSGLSLVFNLRQTTLDLHLFYEEVIKRGGYNQVTKDAMWGEVASTLHLKSNITMFPTQLQKVYEILLLQFEQLYYYRSREKGTMQPPSQVSDAARLEPVKDYNLSQGSTDRSDDSVGKRKFCDQSSPVVTLHSNDKDGPVEKRKCKNNSRLVSTGPETPEQKSQSSLTKKYLKKDPRAPIRTRSSYQMYIKLEYERLKNVLGESSGSKKIRDMAINSWKTLSENDKEPYIEASKLDKERYIREMAAYEQHKSKETGKNPNLHRGMHPCAPSGINNGYYVTSEADSGSNIVLDASFIESTVQISNNGKTSNPIFQMDWGYFA